MLPTFVNNHGFTSIISYLSRFYKRILCYFTVQRFGIFVSKMILLFVLIIYDYYFYVLCLPWMSPAFIQWFYVD